MLNRLVYLVNTYIWQELKYFWLFCTDIRGFPFRVNEIVKFDGTY